MDDFWGIDKHNWQLKRDEERRKHIFISKTEEMRRMMVHVGAIQVLGWLIIGGRVGLVGWLVGWLCCSRTLVDLIPFFHFFFYFNVPTVLSSFLYLFYLFSLLPLLPFPHLRPLFSSSSSPTPRNSTSAQACCPMPPPATSKHSIDTTKQETNCNTIITNSHELLLIIDQ